MNPSGPDELARGSMIVLYTDIGRGHPNYLDSVMRYIRKNHPEKYQNIHKTSVFTISRGLSRLSWQSANLMYRIGSSGGFVSRLYSRMRSGSSVRTEDSSALRLLGRDIRKYFADYNGLCVVGHPLIASILVQSNRVHYINGEIAAPSESAVVGVERVYVPLRETAQKMISLGVEPEVIFETGLMIEPEIHDGTEGAISRRLERVGASSTPLTIGFFVSGAYPKNHVRLMRIAAKSCHRCGHRVRMFWGWRHDHVRNLLDQVRKFDPAVSVDSDCKGDRIDSETVVISGKSREEETLTSLKYISGLDVFCAAPHERVNWAVGIGLPMVLILPTIGSFAPENRDIVLKSKCGISISGIQEASILGERLCELRDSGGLSEMVKSGWGAFPISGARRTAEALLDSMASPSHAS